MFEPGQPQYISFGDGVYSVADLTSDPAAQPLPGTDPAVASFYSRLGDVTQRLAQNPAN